VLGLPPDEFWDLTPYEFDRMVSGWEIKQRWRREELAQQTVIICNCCGHLRKLLTIQDLIPSEQGEQSAEEQLEIMKTLNEKAKGETRGQVRETLTEEEVWTRIGEMRK